MKRKNTAELSIHDIMFLNTHLHNVGSDATWAFAIGDYNIDGKPNVYAIAKDATQSVFARFIIH